MEIRSLNSKNLELNFRIPYSYRPYEDELRTAIKPKLLRGKSRSQFNHKTAGSVAAKLNKDIISGYIQQLSEIAETTPELLPIAIRLPDALLRQNFYQMIPKKKKFLHWYSRQ